MKLWQLAISALAGAAIVAVIAMDDPGARQAERPTAAERRPAPSTLRQLPLHLPPGIRVIPERHGFLAWTDVLAGELALPTGGLAVDDYFGGDPQVAVRVPAGRHTVRITLADSVEYPASGARVALATLETGRTRPVRWRRLGIMGTDGGIGGFASAEAAERMTRDRDGTLHDRQLELLEARLRDGVAEVPVGDRLSLFTFTTGLGDGGYPVYAGIDRNGRVVRVVLDCALLHLAWPS